MRTSASTRLVLALVLPLIASGATAQSDNCSTATFIAVVAPGTCGSVSGTNASATDSGVFPSCDNTNSGYRDVWYTFTTGNATSSVTITLTPSMAMTDWALVVWSGCGGTEVACTVVPTAPVVVSTDPNTTYVIQVYSNLDYGVGGPFTLCVEGSVGGGGGPANDECAGAIALTAGTSCVPTSGTVLNATQSPNSTFCAVGTNHTDVWYRFVATATDMHIEVDPGQWFDAVVAVYEGSCGALGEDGCIDEAGAGGTEAATLSNATVGATYWIRVFTYAGLPTTPEFTICVWAPAPPPPPPANDDCAGAFTIPMSQGCTFTAGDGAYATPSALGQGCNGTGAEDDVWYRFTATNGDVRITVDGNGTSTNGYDPVVELLYSSNCSPPDQLACVNATGPGGTEQIEFSGIAVGLTYYVLVYDAGTSPPANTTFNICVESLGPNTAVQGPVEGVAPWSAAYDPISTSVRIFGAAPGRGTWRIVDANGRTVGSGSCVFSPHAALDIHPPALAQGIYAIEISGEGARRAQRFLVD